MSLVRRAAGLFALFVSLAAAQHFVYTNNGTAPNTVSGWRVDDSGSGALSVLPGSPYATNGNASTLTNADFAATRIVTSTASNSLFATNEDDGSISGFGVDPGTGILTPSSSGPVQSGLGPCPAGLSLAVSPDGQYLVAGSACTNQLVIFYHGGGGALYSIFGGASLSSCGNSGTTGSLAFVPNQKYVVVANSACMTVESFTFGATGSLQAVSGSPFPLGTGSAMPAFGVTASCDSSFVVAGEAQPNNGKQAGQLLNAFTLGSDGSLTPVSGQPFAGRGLSSPSVTFSPDGKFVFASSKVYNTVSTFAVGSGGSLTETQTSPASDPNAAPGQIAVSSDGSYLYVANGTPAGVGVFSIGADGTLSAVSGSPYANSSGNSTGAFDSVAVFPSTCVVKTTLSASPSSLSFDGPVGQTTPTQTVTVTNTGTTTISFHTVQVVDGAFSDPVNTCFSNSIQPGQSCTVQIAFKPSAPQIYTGQINLISNGTPSTLTISLTGTGENATAPNVVFSPPSLDFGNVNVGSSATQGFSILNNGGSDLHISSDSVTGPFTATPACFPSVISPGAECNVSITFSPTDDTAVTGSLTITDDAGSGKQTINFTGTGVAVSGPALTVSPDSIDFGSTVIGTSHVQTVTLTNSGTQPLVISGLSLTNNTDYSFAPGCAITLQPGVFCQFTISYHPQTTDASSVALVIQSNVTNPNGIPLSGQGVTTCTPDTDGDGICDDWEKNGYYARIKGQDVFIDLPSMGADPNHKDVFIHADYMQIDKPNKNAHTHKPLPGTDTLAEAMFNSSPVNTNPDGKTGIHLHVDCGPDCVMNPVTGAKWGSLSRAAEVAEVEPLSATGPLSGAADLDWSVFDTESASFNQTGRLWTFHHVIFAHDLEPPVPNSATTELLLLGLSRNGADISTGASDFAVGLGSAGAITSTASAGTMAHELGHNLGLQHGGNDSYNNKPNYLSIMNYSFTQSGLIINGKSGTLDYSEFAGPSLNEGFLLEGAGLSAPSADAAYGTIWTCPNGTATRTIQINQPINWNCSTDPRGNPTFDASAVSADINGDKTVEILNGYSDWPNLVFTGGAIGRTASSGASMRSAMIEPGTPVNPLLPPLNSVVVEGAQAISLTPGSSADFAFTIENKGINEDTYNVTATGPAGWIDGSGLPATVTIPGGQSVVVHATVSVPAGTTDGTYQFVSVTASSPDSTVMGASQFAVYASSSASPAVLSTDTLNAGTVTLGNAPSITRVTLSNSGTSTLSISGVAITGDFTENNDCGDSLAAGTSCVIEVSFSPGAAGTSTGTLTITDSAPDSPQVVQIQGTGLAAAVGAPQIGAVVNAATSARGGVSAGSLFALYGLNLAPNVSTPQGLPLPTELSGTTVTFNGVQAPLLYAGATQINGQVPFEIPQGTVTVVVTRADGGTSTADVEIVPVAPGFFEFYGGQHLAAQNLDYSVNSTTHPAHPSGYIITYYTGQGALDQTVTTGESGPTSPVANTAAKTTATIGGVAAKVTFSGLAPYEIGVAQADIQIPATGPGGTPWTAGDYPVVLTIGGVVSNTGLISIAP